MATQGFAHVHRQNEQGNVSAHCAVSNLFRTCPSTVPVAVVHPKQGATVTATENHTAVLVCRAEGVPTPRMSWTSPDGTVQLENKSEEVNLTMASVSRHSAGSYTCNATNELGSDSVSVALDVWCKC